MFVKTRCYTSSILDLIFIIYMKGRYWTGYQFITFKLTYLIVCAEYKRAQVGDTD
jgi:hypothetical protein